MTVAEAFAGRVVRWQASHGRSGLPWQGTRDPYRVWLSEIMLQQTQVATVLGYYQRFLDRFPDVAALAAADLDAVLGLWSGLGYYSRARNLHRCAQEVVARHGGTFPGSAAQLAGLPGIGASTAAAIAAFCFGERVAIMDANVRRVLARVLGFDADLSGAGAQRELWRQASDLLPASDLDEAMPRYTQGLMDLGAGICLPRKPLCLLCPLAEGCVAARSGEPERLPVRTRTLRRSAERWWLLVARNQRGDVWLQRRPASGVWGGLYCFPVFGELADLTDAVDAARADRGQPPRQEETLLHVLTHKDLYLHPVTARLAAEPRAEGAWAAAADWQRMGLPAPVRQLLQALPG